MRPQQFGSFGAFEPVFSIEDIGRPAVGTAYRAGIWESFDLSCSLLAIVAITGGADNRLAERFEFDATAGACCDHGWRAGHLLVITMRLPSLSRNSATVRPETCVDSAIRSIALHLLKPLDQPLPL